MTTATAAPGAATPVLVSRFGIRRHLALASFWFGGNYHWGTILPILIPYQIATMLPRAQQPAGLGVVLGGGAVIAMTLPPIVGWWSDRISTPWGRRRPIIVVFSVLNAVALLLLMAASSFWLLLLAYLAVQILNNAAGAAFNAVVPDVVPQEEFGRQSGILGVMVQLGIVASLGTYIGLSAIGRPLLEYVAIAAALLLTMLPTIWAAAGEGMTPLPARASQPPLVALRAFLAPLWTGDFGWVIFTRLMITAGIWSVLPFIQYFFRDVGRIRHADTFTSEWELVLLAAAVPLGLAGGWLSDRFGRKKFVYAAGALQGLTLVVFVATYTQNVAWIFGLGALYGVGYGLYYAVDWALACDTLPDRTQAAKDMGLFHVAYTLPQVLFPSILGFVLGVINGPEGTGGYRVVFSFGIVFYLLGTILVSRIRSVR